VIPFRLARQAPRGLAFARIETFAPLNGLLEDSPPQPVAPDAAEAARLQEEAQANLTEARKLITECGYHRRDESLPSWRPCSPAPADLPPRV